MAEILKGFVAKPFSFPETFLLKDPYFNTYSLSNTLGTFNNDIDCGETDLVNFVNLSLMIGRY